MGEKVLYDLTATCPDTGKDFAVGIRLDDTSTVEIRQTGFTCPHCGKVHVMDTKDMRRVQVSPSN